MCLMTDFYLMRSHVRVQRTCTLYVYCTMYDVHVLCIVHVRVCTCTCTSTYGVHASGPGCHCVRCAGCSAGCPQCGECGLPRHPLPHNRTGAAEGGGYDRTTECVYENVQERLNTYMYMYMKIHVHENTCTCIFLQIAELKAKLETKTPNKKTVDQTEVTR